MQSNKAFESKMSIAESEDKSVLSDSRVKNFKCDICEKSFSFRSRLKNHETFVHSEVSKSKCHICGKYFKKIDPHIKKVHSGRKVVHNCDICEKSFGCPYSLKTHFQTAHEKHDRLQCDYCDKS